MTPKKLVALVIACLLVGVLIGYLFWGLTSDRLAAELAEVRGLLAAETERAAEQQRQVEAKLTEAESRLKQLAQDLEFERQRRAKLELLLSRGRK